MLEPKILKKVSGMRIYGWICLIRVCLLPGQLWSAPEAKRTLSDLKDFVSQTLSIEQQQLTSLQTQLDEADKCVATDKQTIKMYPLQYSAVT